LLFLLLLWNEDVFAAMGEGEARDLPAARVIERVVVQLTTNQCFDKSVVSSFGIEKRTGPSVNSSPGIEGQLHKYLLHELQNTSVLTLRLSVANAFG
jgi:hypothetical protein